MHPGRIEPSQEVPCSGGMLGHSDGLKSQTALPFSSVSLRLRLLAIYRTCSRASRPLVSGPICAPPWNTSPHLTCRLSYDEWSREHLVFVYSAVRFFSSLLGLRMFIMAILRPSGLDPQRDVAGATSGVPGTSHLPTWRSITRYTIASCVCISP